MFWTLDRAWARWGAAAVVMVAGWLAGGCAQPAPQAPSRPPLLVDGAMQRRDFERSVAFYPNGDTVSGVNRFPIRTNADPNNHEYGAAGFDIAASLAQTVALPFTYLFIPPFAPAVYHGDDVPPTYTAMPQMRPPETTVKVDGLVVDRDTLQVRKAPQQTGDEASGRHGPQGPNDTEFQSPPAPNGQGGRAAPEWE